VKITSPASVVPMRLVERGEAATPSSRPTGLRTDRVSLSGDVQRLQQQDAERIKALTEQIAEGRYQVDLERLAAAIIAKEDL